MGKWILILAPVFAAVLQVYTPTLLRVIFIQAVPHLFGSHHRVTARFKNDIVAF